MEKDLRGSMISLHDEVKEAHVQVKMIGGSIAQLEHERKVYIADKESLRAEIKDFETLMSEFRTIHDRQYIDLKKSYERQLNDLKMTFNDQNVERNQIKAMIRN